MSEEKKNISFRNRSKRNRMKKRNKKRNQAKNEKATTADIIALKDHFDKMYGRNKD